MSSNKVEPTTSWISRLREYDGSKATAIIAAESRGNRRLGALTTAIEKAAKDELIKDYMKYVQMAKEKHHFDVFELLWPLMCSSARLNIDRSINFNGTTGSAVSIGGDIVQQASAAAASAARSPGVQAFSPMMHGNLPSSQAFSPHAFSPDAFSPYASQGSSPWHFGYGSPAHLLYLASLGGLPPHMGYAPMMSTGIPGPHYSPSPLHTGHAAMMPPQEIPGPHCSRSPPHTPPSPGILGPQHLLSPSHMAHAAMMPSSAIPGPQYPLSPSHMGHAAMMPSPGIPGLHDSAKMRTSYEENSFQALGSVAEMARKIGMSVPSAPDSSPTLDEMRDSTSVPPSPAPALAPQSIPSMSFSRTFSPMSCAFSSPATEYARSPPVGYGNGHNATPPDGKQWPRDCTGYFSPLA